MFWIFVSIKSNICLGKIALAVASSGIAATLLPGGRTAHSTFKLPIDLINNENPTCNIKRGTNLAKLLEQTLLIVWDECTMAHKKAFEALDKTLQDIRRNSNVMGGITVLFSGDFRQTLPVISRGTPADEVNACLKNSYLWSHIQKLNLTINMRVQLTGSFEAAVFSHNLIQLGDGKIPQDANG